MRGEDGVDFNKTGLFDGKIVIYNSIETEYTELSRGWRYIHGMNSFIEPNGFLSEMEYAELIADMKETAASGQYLWMSPYYVYRGKKK